MYSIDIQVNRLYCEILKSFTYVLPKNNKKRCNLFSYTVYANRFCDTDRIQTCDLLIRSQMLYSAKLRCRPFCECKYKLKNLYRQIKIAEIFRFYLSACDCPRFAGPNHTFHPRYKNPSLRHRAPDNSMVRCNRYGTFTRFSRFLRAY